MFEIAILILVPILCCYIVFKNFIYNLVKTEELWFKIMTDLQFSKLLLFILLSLTIPWVILLVYHYIFNGETDNYKSVISIIYVCFFSIISTTFILLEFAPYLVNIFENTLGYLFLFIPIINWNNKIKVFSEMFNQQQPIDQQQNTNQSIDKNNSYAFLITTMSLFNIDSVINNLSNNQIKLKISDDNKNIIKELVLLKHSVGHFVWIYFASLICTFTSIKAFAKYLPTTL